MMVKDNLAEYQRVLSQGIKRIHGFSVTEVSKDNLDVEIHSGLSQSLELAAWEGKKVSECSQHVRSFLAFAKKIKMPEQMVRVVATRGAGSVTFSSPLNNRTYHFRF